MRDISDAASGISNIMLAGWTSWPAGGLWQRLLRRLRVFPLLLPAYKNGDDDGVAYGKTVARRRVTAMNDIRRNVNSR